MRPFVLVDFLPVIVHLPATVRTDDFAFKEIDKRCPDCRRLFHLGLPCLRCRRYNVLHLLKVLAGDDWLMGVGKDDPFVFVLDIVGLDALVDGLHGASEDGISDIVRIGQDAVERRTAPTLAGASIPGTGSGLPLAQLGVWCAQAVKLIKDRRD